MLNKTAKINLTKSPFFEIVVRAPEGKYEMIFPGKIGIKVFSSKYTRCINLKKNWPIFSSLNPLPS